jgi:hypothetical protein
LTAWRHFGKIAGVNKIIGIFFGAFVALVAILTVAMQSFVIGTTRYRPADKPARFWAGVGLLVVLAAFFFQRALRGRNKSAPIA